MNVDISTVQQPTFAPIGEGLLEVLAEMSKSPLSNELFIRIYTQIYNFCNYRGTIGDGCYSNSFLLYLELQAFLCKLLDEKVTQPLHKVISQPQEFFAFYQSNWHMYISYSRIVGALFQYLDRYLVFKSFENNKPIVPIEMLCMQCWETQITKFLPNFPSLIEKILTEERNAGTSATSSEMLKDFFFSFVKMKVKVDMNAATSELDLSAYQNVCNDSYNNIMQKYYDKFITRYLSEHSFDDFVLICESLLDMEEERINYYLHPSSYNSSKLVLYCCFFDKYLLEFQTFLTDQIHLFNEEKLKTFFNVSSRYENYLEKYQTVFENVLKVEMSQFFQNVANANEPEEHPAKIFFDACLSLYSKYRTLLIDKIFNSEYHLSTAFDKAFKVLLNKNAFVSGSNVASELLAKYSDLLLKKGSKPVEEALNYSKRIDEIVQLFRYLEEKDNFQHQYGRFLSRRLVNGTVESEDLENEMISKLKDACGFEFIAKFQKMMSDSALSKELNNEFEKSEFYNQTDGTYQVLCMGTWPLSTSEQDASFSSSQIVNDSMQHFSNFYVQRHSGRKLIWLPQFSRAEVSAKIGSNKYTFQVSLYQATILQMFNDSHRLSFQQIQQATHISTETLSCIMEVFLKSKLLIGINCNFSQFDSIKDGAFEINALYSSKKVRVNLNAPLRIDLKNETEKTIKTVKEDRTILIQAAIVRIMKSKRTLKYVHLIQETINELQSKFVPEVPDIKQSIEVLLERDFLARSKDSVDVLVYVA